MSRPAAGNCGALATTARISLTFSGDFRRNSFRAANFRSANLTKEEVRALARRTNLPVAEKPESMELCFVPTGNYVQFIQAYSKDIGDSALPHGDDGQIVTEDGAVVGHHQRRAQFHHRPAQGTWVCGWQAALRARALTREKNRVVVGNDETLRTTTCDVQGVNWISIEQPAGPLRATVKIRHKHEPAGATIARHRPRLTSAQIVFDAPQRAITAGQGAVFYDGERVLGGGWIR